MSILLYTIIIFAAFGGFLLAFYIGHKKRSREKMVCPLDSDCNAVIYSEYSKFLGIPMELLGMLYYGLIALGYAVLLVVPDFVPPFAIFGALVITVAAFLFSVYLTFLQAFAIKEWCTWCLMSAGLCTIIFTAALINSEFAFISFLSDYSIFIETIHSFAFSLGIGAATISGVLFFKFLKDLRVSDDEASVMHVLSDAILFFVAVLVLSGVGIYLPDADALNHSSVFHTKAFAILVLIANGAYLNIFLAPKLVKISLGQIHGHEPGELRSIRRLAFALGGVSLTSWYFSFFLEMAGTKIEFGFSGLFLCYLAIVVLAGVMSQFIERIFVR